MKTIYPVIVIYKTRLADAESYRTLLRPNGIKDFLVYDNSPADYEQQETSFPEGVTYVRDTSNSGLPKAYNLGARKARELGYGRVLLLDQDTQFAPGTWECYERHAGYDGITAPLMKTKQGDSFSPIDIRGWRPRANSGAQGGEYSLYDYAVVNSGCCVPVSLYEKAGGYREGVKLDFADFQFQLAARVHCPTVLLFQGSPAIQDFSNEHCSVEQLLARFSLFLESARHYSGGTLKLQAKHNYVVLRHTLALFLRTRNLRFVQRFVKDYLLKKRP